MDDAMDGSWIDTIVIDGVEVVENGSAEGMVGAGDTASHPRIQFKVIRDSYSHTNLSFLLYYRENRMRAVIGGRLYGWYGNGL